VKEIINSNVNSKVKTIMYVSSNMIRNINLEIFMLGCFIKILVKLVSFVPEAGVSQLHNSHIFGQQ